MTKISEGKISEQAFVGRIVTHIIRPRFGSSHLHGEVGKLRAMTFNEVFNWMKRFAVLSREEEVALLKRYGERVKPYSRGRR